MISSHALNNDGIEFPSIFGPNKDESLSLEASRLAFEELTVKINQYFHNTGRDRQMSVEEVACGFIEVSAGMNNND